MEALGRLTLRQQPEHRHVVREVVHISLDPGRSPCAQGHTREWQQVQQLGEGEDHGEVGNLEIW